MPSAEIAVGPAADAGPGDALLVAILDGLPIAVMLRGADGSLLHANPAFERYLARLGVDLAAVRGGADHLMDHVEVLDEHGRLHDRSTLPVVASLRDRVPTVATVGYGLPGGGHAWYEVRATPVDLGDGTTGTVVTCDDVTERRAALAERHVLEQELRDAALKDPLTGLANRRALAQRLAELQQRRARVPGAGIGLLYLDLDDFKAVNDRFGHLVGDEVLVEVGRRLVAATREVDLVCRLGGDEFVVLCAPIDRRGLAELAERLGTLPELVVGLAGQRVRITESTGIAVVEPQDDLEHALHRADGAMYRAKRGAAGRDPLATRAQDGGG